MINHQKVDDRKGFYKSSWLQLKTYLEQSYFNFLNVAFLFKWCHLMVLRMLILIKDYFEVIILYKKMLNLFLKDLFLVIFCIFLICYKLSIECQTSIIFHCFWHRGLHKDLYHNILIFQYLTFVELFLLINFYVWGTLLHYQIFLLPFLMNISIHMLFHIYNTNLVIITWSTGLLRSSYTQKREILLIILGVFLELNTENCIRLECLGHKSI